MHHGHDGHGHGHLVPLGVEVVLRVLHRADVGPHALREDRTHYYQDYGDALERITSPDTNLHILYLQGLYNAPGVGTNRGHHTNYKIKII